MKPEIFQGSAVISKKGRDKGRVFVVLYWLGTDFLMLCDGDLRKVDHPKKKKRLHVTALPFTLTGIVDLYSAGQLKDSDVRKALSDVIEKTKVPIKPLNGDDRLTDREQASKI